MNLDKESVKAGSELLEVVIDTFVSPDGLVKEIPFVSTLFALSETCNTYRNRRFTRRVTNFLTNFNVQEFNKFKSAIKNKNNEDLGEEILSVIENLEKKVQVNMVARATKMHIALLENGHSSGSIKYILDYNLHIIKHLDSHLLAGLHAIYSGEPSVRRHSVDQALFNIGLLEQEIEPTFIGKTLDNKLSFKPSEQGRAFYRNIVCE